jgi:cytochrome c553
VGFILVTFFLATGSSFGQLVRTEIPYEFTFAAKVLPAGTYTFSLTTSGLRAQSATGAIFTAPIVTRLHGPTEFLREGSLVFDKTGGGHVLSEVWMPLTDGVLLHNAPKGHSYDILLIYGLDQNSGVSGKVAFDRTCARCHGPAGKGDPRADKFFNTKVPRLNSAEVQAKSDSELKEIIKQGSGVMDPVEIDEGGFRHRLPLQSIDGVIAYVRTLKQ